MVDVNKDVNKKVEIDDNCLYINDKFMGHYDSYSKYTDGNRINNTNLIDWLGWEFKMKDVPDFEIPDGFDLVYKIPFEKIKRFDMYDSKTESGRQIITKEGA